MSAENSQNVYLGVEVWKDVLLDLKISKNNYKKHDRLEEGFQYSDILKVYR